MIKLYNILLLGLFIIFLGCKEKNTAESNNNELVLPTINSIGDSNKIEVVTWNIEHFPKTDNSDVYVKTIFEGLDADIYILQEIQSESKFASMLGEMENYNYLLHKNRTGLGLAIVYKTDIIKIKNSYDLFEDDDHFFAGRPPLVTKIEWQANGLSKELTIINLHLKCCGDNKIEIGNNEDEEYRRVISCHLLHNYVIDSLKNDNVMVVGDWNDAIQEHDSTNIFQVFIDDFLNFKFADMEIANGDKANWSWQGWSSSYPAIHFDHILISNNLFDEFENSSLVESIKIDELFENGSSEYDNNISDHRPVYFKFNP